MSERFSYNQRVYGLPIAGRPYTVGISRIYFLVVTGGGMGQLGQRPRGQRQSYTGEILLWDGKPQVTPLGIEPTFTVQFNVTRQDAK